MTFVVTLIGYTPSPRYDGRPWTQARIGESSSLTGAPATIDTLTLVPADGDPVNPQTRNLTTANATLPSGWYTVTFLDAAGSQEVFSPVLYPTTATASGQPDLEALEVQIRPTLIDLGSLMRARTTVASTGGTEIGTFTSTTRPTDAEANDLLDRAVDIVALQMGANIGPAYYNVARNVVLFYAAMLVELTFYRNEVNRDQSAYAQYVVLYQQALAALNTALQSDTPNQARIFSTPVHTLVRYGLGTGRLDPFDTNLLP